MDAAEVAALGVFLTPDGRLPGFAQRRLEYLIEKKKRSSLTPQEEKDLAEALDYIDEKSIRLLEYAALQTRAIGRSNDADEPLLGMPHL